MTRVAALLLAFAMLVPATARAAFSPPVELATGTYSLAIVAATDAAGTTTAVVTGAHGGAQLRERTAGAAWPPPSRLPGDHPSVHGPVVAAAGVGALGIAWRVDRPRKYTGIDVVVRDPGGALSQPIAVAGAAAGGVRYPALDVDASGDALLAYCTRTRANHLSLQGAIAVAYRRAGGSFSAPVVVDREPSSAPVAALAPDGSGIVAWTRSRRVYAVSIDADGHIGRARAVTPPHGASSLVAAAGDGGAATLAWIDHHAAGTHTRYVVRALRRSAGHAFAPARAIASTARFASELTIAADDSGSVTLAWTEDRFGGNHSVGENGITTAIRAAAAPAGRAFGAPLVVAAPDGTYRAHLSIAAARGRVALAWGYQTDRHHLGVQAMAALAGQPQAVATTTVPGNVFTTAPRAAITLSDAGAATAFAVVPVAGADRQLVPHLLASDGD